VGVNIPEAMFVPEDAPADEYLTTFIYEKDGVQKSLRSKIIPKMIRPGFLLTRKQRWFRRDTNRPSTTFR